MTGRQIDPAGLSPRNPNRRPDPETRVWAVIDSDARAAATERIQAAFEQLVKAYGALTRGGRLDVAARDLLVVTEGRLLEDAVQALTTDVDRRLATANKVLDGRRLKVVAA